MGEIYRQARCVRVWLGEGGEDGEEGVNVMNSLLESGNLTDFRLDGQCINKQHIRAAASLSNRPWWDRFWVLQEVALARQCTLRCGKAVFHGVDFERLMLNLVSDYTGDRLDQIQGLRREMNSFGTALKQTSGYLYAMALEKEEHRSPIFEVDILVGFSKHKSSDARDKVYGCLGLLPRLSKVITPNYKLSVEEVHILTTFALITLCGSLYPFKFLGRSIECRSSDIVSMRLPSWTLDFSQNCDRLQTTFSCMTSNGFPWMKQPKLNDNFLILKGMTFDEVVSCHRLDEALDWRSSSYVRSRYSEWCSYFELVMPMNWHAAYVGGDTIEKAFWTTLVGGSTENHCYGSQSPQELLYADVGPFREWIQTPELTYLAPSSPEWREVWRTEKYGEALERTMDMFNAYLFTTRRGYFGLSFGNNDLRRVGDQLYFLDGGLMPYALRSVEDKQDNEEFNIICECYVHGVMHGEAFKPPPDFSSQQWKRHELRRKVFGGQPLDTTLPIGPWKDISLC